MQANQIAPRTIPDVRSPTTIVVGGKDTLLPSLSEAQRLQALINSNLCEIELLETSGHAILDDRLDLTMTVERLVARNDREEGGGSGSGVGGDGGGGGGSGDDRDDGGVGGGGVGRVKGSTNNMATTTTEETTRTQSPSPPRSMLDPLTAKQLHDAVTTRAAPLVRASSPV